MLHNSSLTNHCGRLQDITLDHVRKTADATTVSVFVRLPNNSLLEFQIDGAYEAEGRWKFYGHPSALLEITETDDGIPEKIITSSTSPQMENDLNRVLNEIEAGDSE